MALMLRYQIHQLAQPSVSNNKINQGHHNIICFPCAKLTLFIGLYECSRILQDHSCHKIGFKECQVLMLDVSLVMQTGK